MAGPIERLPHVIIVGGGFAGLNVARSLRRAPVNITLIDRENYHLFQPLLYQVATAALNPGDIAYPLRSALRGQRNASVLLAEVVAIKADSSEIELDNGSLSFDFLVVATGATHSYFGHPEWESSAPGLKTIEDALEIRRRIYLAYEAAERESDPANKERWLTFVVVGGGPTGVELAGALAEIGRQTLARDFRSIDPTQVRVLLVEGQDRILSAYPESLSKKAVRQLSDLGVEVRTSAFATEIDEAGVTIGGERIQARTTLWAAGVKASPLVSSLGTPMDNAGRLIVDQDLSVPGFPTVFVCGDVAHVSSADGQMVPGVSPAAIQQGKHAAKNILRLVGNQETVTFEYWDKGSLATIGRGKAIADLGRVKFSGALAWLAWLFIHVFFLIGFRNRLWVLSGWAWSYLTFQRGARLITGKKNLSELPEVVGKNDHKRTPERNSIPM